MHICPINAAAAGGCTQDESDKISMLTVALVQIMPFACNLFCQRETCLIIKIAAVFLCSASMYKPDAALCIMLAFRIICY